MNTALKCINVTKKFKDVIALNEINLELKENKFYGLLGANGAGKTTLLKTISNQLFPDKGTIKIFGEEFQHNENLVKKICYVKDNNPYLRGLKANDIIDFAKISYKDWDYELEEIMRKKFNIKNKVINQLSKGQQSAINIIVGICSNAKITIFDEAYIGLDPINRSFFFNILRESFQKNPRTIIITTHFIEEIEGLFEEVILINNGKIITHETTDNILERAYTIVGNIEKILNIVGHKNILKKENIGRFGVVHIYDELSNKDKEVLVKENLEVNRMTLQNWFINMITE